MIRLTSQVQILSVQLCREKITSDRLLRVELVPGWNPNMYTILEVTLGDQCCRQSENVLSVMSRMDLHPPCFTGRVHMPAWVKEI